MKNQTASLKHADYFEFLTERSHIRRTSAGNLSCLFICPWQRGHLYLEEQGTLVLCSDTSLKFKLIENSLDYLASLLQPSQRLFLEREPGSPRSVMELIVPLIPSSEHWRDFWSLVS
jgi:hypothetical protein